ncbi:MAG TPA: hypothetical protein VFW75_10660 [Acetobacteraceae bacterium]|nr:hypothetical protein [Acetobacteraceae bacterium]
MSDNTSLETVTELLRRAGAIAPPAVAQVISVIRSGDQFLIAPPGPAPAAGVPSSLFIAPLVIEWGYDVEYDRARQFQRWLQDNEPALASSAPKGVTYRGTYAVFAESDLSLGSYRTVWGFDSFDGLQAMHGLCSQAGSQFARLVDELNSFRDRRIGAGSSQQIYQPAAQALRI